MVPGSEAEWDCRQDSVAQIGSAWGQVGMDAARFPWDSQVRVSRRSPSARVVPRRDACSRCLPLGIFSKWMSEAGEAGECSGGSRVQGGK